MCEQYKQNISLIDRMYTEFSAHGGFSGFDILMNVHGIKKQNKNLKRS